MSDLYWDDLRVTAQMVVPGAMEGGDHPLWTSVCVNQDRGPSMSGLGGWRFGSGGASRFFQNAFFVTQLPHGYLEGAAIEPHIHCELVPEDEAAEGQVLTLELEYRWTNPGELYPSDSEIRTVNFEVHPGDWNIPNLIISFGEIRKPEARISSLIECRFSRIREGQGEEALFPAKILNDDFCGALIFKEFDFHYPSDVPGSRKPYQK